MELPIQLANIAYFMLGSQTAISHIKQCLHYDPDSKPCKKVHKLLRGLEKKAAQVRNFVDGGNHRQAIKLLDGPDGLLASFEAGLESAGIPSKLTTRHSQARLDLYALACKAAVGANDFTKRGARWCDITLEMDENNVDALIGQSERLMKEENWEAAVRVLEKAFEQSGRSSQDVS